MSRPSRPQEDLDKECCQVGELIRIQNKSYFEVSELTGLNIRQVRVHLDRYDQFIALANLSRSAEDAYNTQMASLEAIQRQTWEENALLQQVLNLLSPIGMESGEDRAKATEQEIAESIEELIGGNPELSPILKKVRQVKKRHSYTAFFKALELSQKNKDLLLKVLEKKNELLGLTKDPQIAIVQNTEAIALRYWEAAESKYQQLKSAKPVDETDSDEDWQE